VTGVQESGRRALSHGSDDPWTILKLILWSADYLAAKGVPNARLDAEHLLAHVAGVERLQLYLDFERPLSSAELDGYRPLLRRRATREPLQYILGRQPFRELDLEITRAVLIPRPETEVLVSEVLAWAASERREGLTALDVGTGSGAIALSLAFEGPFASVLATDVDEDALEVASRNRDGTGLAERVELRHGTLFDPVGPGERFDVVVSNPPYVAESEVASLEPEVVDWEPKRALFAGPEGLDVLRELIPRAAQVLRPNGLLALEVGHGQATDVVRLVAEVGAYEDVRTRRDYGGKERIVLARCA
jgi:release factor glutamine methyltransferase